MVAVTPKSIGGAGLQGRNYMAFSDV
jgi:hypothetical protein